MGPIFAKRLVLGPILNSTYNYFTKIATTILKLVLYREKVGQLGFRNK